MVSSKHGARISETDLQQLDEASNHLAAAATTIQRAKPSWGDPVVQLLILANNTILRIRDKGAGAFARYLEKHGLQKTQDVTEAPPAADNPASSRISSPGEEER